MGRRGVVTCRRLAAIGAFFLLWGGALGVRLFHLHVVEAGYYRERASQQHQRELELSPQRGAIRDRNNNDLAVSIEVDSVYAEPAKVENPQATAAFLAPILEVPADALRARLVDDRSFVWLKRKISAAQSGEIRAAGLSGIGFERESKRFYPNIQLAAHVLGFVNLDNRGGSGIEYQYEEIIGGTPGRMVVQRDAHNVTFERIELSPTEGASLTMTLDANIQHFAEEEIERTVRETRAVGMSVIVMNPRTGEILAMANYPTFNPNEYGRSPDVNWSNRAISHVYEPGSTFKVATAAAVLEEGLARMDEVVDGQNGAIMVHGYRIRDHKPFGLLTFREVLQYSSNVGIIKLGTRLGDSVFARYIDRFGFGRRTGIDLMGEERGITRPAQEWSRLSSSVISMGQEIGATPIQILNLVAAVANGGMMYRPFVVKRFEHVNGRVEETAPEGRRVMGGDTAALLQDALARVVTDGTGQPAAIPGYTAAGKTGTAQKIEPGTGTYSATRHVASFAGYAPATDPSIVAIVVIDEPRGAYHGGEVAAPVFGRLAARILRYIGAQPDAPAPAPGYTEDGDGSSPSAPGPRPATDVASPLQSRPADGGWQRVAVSLGASADPGSHPAGGTEFGRLAVPDFNGQPLREVFSDAASLGLRLLSSGSGVAVEQWPLPGALVAPETEVRVRFSTERQGVWRTLTPAP